MKKEKKFWFHEGLRFQCIFGASQKDLALNFPNTVKTKKKFTHEVLKGCAIRSRLHCFTYAKQREQYLTTKSLKCFACCTGGPGYVWLVGDEAEKIAQYLSISIKEFYKKWTIKHANRISIKEKKKSFKTYYDCIFLDRIKGCKIYPVRPAQCISYPFWKEITQSRETWEVEASLCPGINQGQLRTCDEILTMIKKKLPSISRT